MPKLIDCLALHVEKYRKQQGLSQEALGKLAGLTKQAIWNIEHSKTGTSFETIVKLAKALNVEETDLVSESRLTVKDYKAFYDLTLAIESMRKENEVLRNRLGVDLPSQEFSQILSMLNESQKKQLLEIVQLLTPDSIDHIVRDIISLLPNLDEPQRRGLLMHIQGVIRIATAHRHKNKIV